MRKIIAGLVVAFAMLVALAPPASAEKPPQIQASATVPDVNACTGENELITLNWTITVHENRRNTVLTFDTTVTTSLGFYGTGTETQVTTADKMLNTLNIRTTNGEQVVMVKGHRHIDLTTGEVVSNSFRTICIRG